MEKQDKFISIKLSNKIYYVNFILASLIIFLHASSLESLKTYESNYKICFLIQKVISIIADSAVPLFFMISAFLLFKKFETSNYIVTIKKRFKSLVIPYLIWSTICWMIYVFLTHTPLISNIINQEKVPLEIKNILIDIIMANYNPPIWFARTLFCIIILSPIFYYIKARNNNILLMISILSLIMNMLIHPSYTSVVFWLPEYTLGIWIASLNKFGKKDTSYVISVISIFTLFVVVGMLVIFKVEEHSTIYYLYRFISAILVWYGIDIFKHIWEIKPSQFMKCSFFMFCSHSIVVMIIRKGLLRIFGSSNLYITIIYFITAMSTIIILCFVSWLLRKKFRKFWNILNGGR